MNNVFSETTLSTGEQAARRFKINCIGGVIIAGFALSVIYHYVLVFYLGKRGYPYNTFLFIPGDAFMDLFNTLNQTAALNPYFGKNRFPSNYYPFAHILLYPFSFFPGRAAALVYSALFIGAVGIINATALRSDDRLEYFRNVFVFTLLTYPVLITLDRGNLEAALFLLLYLGMYLIATDRTTTGALALSGAVALKAFPLAFVGYLLAVRKYRPVILTILFSGLLTLASLAFLDGGFFNNLKFVLSGFGLSSNYLVQNNNLIQRGISLFTVLKVFMIEAGLLQGADMAAILKIYIALSVTLFIFVAAYLFFVKLKTWERLFLLVACVLLLPQISAEYKLMHLYIPMLFFINERDAAPADIFYTMSFGLLMIPKDYYFFSSIRSDSGTSDISIAVVLNPLIILLVAVAIIVSGLRRRSAPEN